MEITGERFRLQPTGEEADRNTFFYAFKITQRNIKVQQIKNYDIKAQLSIYWYLKIYQGHRRQRNYNYLSATSG